MLGLKQDVQIIFYCIREKLVVIAAVQQCAKVCYSWLAESNTGINDHLMINIVAASSGISSL